MYLLIELTIFFSFIFLIKRWTNIDPYNIEETSSILSNMVFSFFLTVCYLFYGELEEKWNMAIASFIIYSIYMPAINPPIKYRKDEEEFWFKRVYESFKTKLGGSIVISGIFIVLPLVYLRFIEIYWFIFIVIFGVVIMTSKFFTAISLNDKVSNEFDTAITTRHKIFMLSMRFIPALILFSVFSFTLGKEIIEEARLNSENWGSFSGILGGYILGLILETITDS